MTLPLSLVWIPGSLDSAEGLARCSPWWWDWSAGCQAEDAVLRAISKPPHPQLRQVPQTVGQKESAARAGQGLLDCTFCSCGTKSQQPHRVMPESLRRNDLPFVFSEQGSKPFQEAFRFKPLGFVSR